MARRGRPPLAVRHKWLKGRCVYCGEAYVYRPEYERPCPARIAAVEAGSTVEEPAVCGRCGKRHLTTEAASACSQREDK